MPPLLELRSHKSYGSGHLLLVRFVSVFYEKGPMVPQQRWAWLGRENSVKHRGMGLGVSKLGSNVGTAVIPAGGHMFMPQGWGMIPVRSFVPGEAVSWSYLSGTSPEMRKSLSLPCDPGVFQIAASTLHLFISADSVSCCLLRAGLHFIMPSRLS